MTHVVFKHSATTSCIWLETYWFEPYDVGGEGVVCERLHDGYTPQCGKIEEHDSHSFMDQHFKEHWCGGLCNCGCTCWEHWHGLHGPGDHK